MARTGRRKTASEMAEVLRRQKELGQTNQECATSAGMSVETIKRWRALLRTHSARVGEPLVEWGSGVPASTEALGIELPGGIRLVVPGSWSPGQIAELVSALRSS